MSKQVALDTLLSRRSKRLLKLDLLRFGEDNKKYVTTEKGLDFIGKYEELEGLLKF